ncbi:MAG TPA: NAD(P)/FAD-dependent oxidoreductase [Candidatus Limnocylindrales bacterium]|nr:NAD(P)/FAD-dependent oxidoreductase [Candidatus Limnocylindrales bacterium]
MSSTSLDAVVVGAGPNGLAAAITLARAGLSVRLLEAADEVGGGLRSGELTLPGYVHDICTAIVGTTAVSPFLGPRGPLDLARHGVEYVVPEAPVGHALDDGRAVVLERSVEATADALGRDGPTYRRLVGPLVRDVDRLMPWIFGRPLQVTRHPIAQARFGIPALLPNLALGRLLFREAPARALLAGLAAHAMVPLERPATASFGLALALSAHASGWPLVRGGTARLAEGLAAELRTLGGEIETGRRIGSLDELPPARAILLDVTPRQLLAIGADLLPDGYRSALERFRYGPGVFKVDWALSGPIPWRSPELARAGTVHLGGTAADVARVGRDVHGGTIPERPFVLLVQPTRFDPTRAPAGSHTAWAYCHVPNGSPADMTSAIETQVERFAPGFRDLVVARATHGAAQLEAHDENYVGGDINGGAQDLRQLFFRPIPQRNPWATPLPGVYLCSSSTPPGGGAHGMCGHLAARSALRREFGKRG